MVELGAEVGPSYFSVMLTGALVRSPEWAMRDTLCLFWQCRDDLALGFGGVGLLKSSRKDRLSIGKHGEAVNRKPRGRTQRSRRSRPNRQRNALRPLATRLHDRRQSGADRLCFIAPLGGRVGAADRFGLVARLQHEAHDVRPIVLDAELRRGKEIGLLIPAAVDVPADQSSRRRMPCNSRPASRRPVSAFRLDE